MEVYMKKLLIAVGVVLVAQAFLIMPVYNKPFYWILFVVFLLFGLYTIYDAIQTEK
jgi:hypothetical protein